MLEYPYSKHLVMPSINNTGSTNNGITTNSSTNSVLNGTFSDPNVTAASGGSSSFCPKDVVESLVKAVRDNLRMDGSSKSSPGPIRSLATRKRLRSVPYHLPPQTIAPRASDAYFSGADDPYEVLQKLLRDGSLVNEAVRRLQHDFGSKKAVRFYESDDDGSPIVRQSIYDS